MKKTLRLASKCKLWYISLKINKIAGRYRYYGMWEDDGTVSGSTFAWDSV